MNFLRREIDKDPKTRGMPIWKYLGLMALLGIVLAIVLIKRFVTGR